MERDEFGETEVTIRVPGFANFGERLAELECKAAQVMKEFMESAEGIEAAIGAISRMGAAQVKAQADLEKKAAAGDELSKLAAEGLAMMNEHFGGLDLEGMMEGMQVESPVGEIKEEDFAIDREELVVLLGEESRWDAQAESRLDAFLSSWPARRPAVLERAFVCYREAYEERASELSKEPGAEHLLPPPTTAEAVADLCCIRSIYLHPGGVVGLGGSCTWDEEHGFGVLLKDNDVLAVGGEDVAFDAENWIGEVG